MKCVHFGMSTDTPSGTQGIGFDLQQFPLTDDQRSAVVYDSGPVIVLAGPGTGKTRVITARVAHMIANRGVNPDQIVAVTFTNKAAGELGDRLSKLVGETTAGRVVSSTFHSLGLKIIRRFGDVLGVSSEPILIDSAQRKGLIREIINDHKLYRYAMGSGVDSAIDIATKVMNELRNQGMSSGDAYGWLSEQRELLGGMEQDQRDARSTELDRFEQAVKVYGHFESVCLNRGWMVFDDLILLPSRLMREHASIASILRYDHKHVVVDEFQDVNGAQIEFVRQLCPPASNPDVCVVGDDDQGIYGFRGADDRAFAHFAGIYPGTPTVTLSTNFRSSDSIVSASNAVIDRAQVRFDASKQAVSHAGEVEGSGIELVRLEGEPQSGEVIAAMLLKMASGQVSDQASDQSEDQSGDNQGFDFGTCAVIARTKNELEMIARVLMLEGIPVDIREQISPMDDEGVQDVIAWARLLGDPGSTVDIKRVLVRPPYRCDAIRVGRLIASWKAKQSHWANGDEEAKDPGLLMDWLVEHADESISGRVKQMHRLAQELGAVASEALAATTVMEIVKRTGVVHSELSDGRARASRVASLVALISFARSRANRFESPGDLGAMLRYWEDLDPGEQSLGELPETKVEQSGGGQEVVQGAGGSRGAVAMLTAHASKGLEFDTVFVPRVSGPHGYPKSSGGDDEVLPDGLIDRAGDVRDGKSRRMDEERRVFYVAITRAEKRAVILSKVPKKPSSVNFVFELREALGGGFIEHDAGEVLDANASGDAVSRLGAEFKAVNRMRDVFDQAKHDARRQAAIAIDRMEQGDIDRDELGVELRRAGDQIAIVRDVLASGELPAWIADSGHEALGELLMDTLGAIERGDVEGGLHPGLAGPLTLSFSQIAKYLQCPRCYLVNYVLRLPQESAVPMLIGTVVHEALDKFYSRWRIADAEGEATPGREEMKVLVEKEFFARWPRDEEVDEDKLEQARALVAMVLDSMHSDDAHIEELEQEYVFGYVCEGADDGFTHKIKAKLDRVDATSSGGRRVIDYKTGAARKDLVTPSKVDLQFGIYAMALEHAFGDLGPGSVCEYWLLAEGVKGVIGIDALDMVKIRKKIDEAIAGMLAGEWSQSNKCKSGRYESSCSVLDRVEDVAELMNE